MDLEPLRPLQPEELTDRSRELPRVSGKSLRSFDRCDVLARCRELLRRLASGTETSASLSNAWKWDILDLLGESKQTLQEIRLTNTTSDRSVWREISDAIEHDRDSTLPVGLRNQCEELLSRRNTWLSDFDVELPAVLTKGQELRERMLFEDNDEAGWFTTAGVTSLEVQRLLERHQDMHVVAARLLRQQQMIYRALKQQGGVSSRRRAFQAKTVGDKLKSSLMSLGAVAITPVPGSGEMWIATTSMMWLAADQAWQHVVYEHPRDADTDAILNQFHCHSSKARAALAQWKEMPSAKRAGRVLIHNASVRRVTLKAHLVNCIDGMGDKNRDWTNPLESHPMGSVFKHGFSFIAGHQEEKKGIVIAPQRLMVVDLPPKPDFNWSCRGVFSYDDTRVGECCLKEGGVFSFICVDCGLRVCERGEKLPEDLPGYDDSPREVGHRESWAEVDVPASPGLAAQDSERTPECEEGGPSTHVEIVNRMDEMVQVKVFAPSAHGPGKLFRTALAEGSVGPGANRVFFLKAERDVDSDFDVEIRIGRRLAKCEVVGEQAIIVDGFAD